MDPTLKILHLEDEPLDSQLVARLLTREGLPAEIERVDTLAGFEAALERGGHALVLSDCTMPGVDALQALRLVRERHPELPFVFVSGTLGEEAAIETLKQGATDYVLKHRMERLVPAVRRALREVEERRAHLEAEQRSRESREQILAQLNALLASAPVGFAFFDREHRYVKINDFLARHLAGLPVNAHLGRPVRELLPVNAQVMDPLLDVVFASGRPLENVVVTGEAPAAPGQQRHWLTVWFPVRTPDGQLPWVGVAVMEITQQKRIEQELQKAREQLADTNVELERRVDARTRELREAVAELEQLSYSMVHDLRAPLRAIHSFAGIIGEDSQNRLSQESHGLLAKMRAAVERMDDLVRDVLNYNKILRGDLPLGPVDVAALARSIISTCPELHPPRAQVRVAPNLPTVFANAGALSQCLSNLLVNAAKFAQPGQTAQIELSAQPCQNGWTRIVVADHGIGISPQAQKKLFGVFQRLTHAATGTGMGLAIVKKAAERMGGRVGVESAPGKGSRFWIELRAAASPRESSDTSFSP